jgi:hypothetical protein
LFSGIIQSVHPPESNCKLSIRKPKMIYESLLKQSLIPSFKSDENRPSTPFSHSVSSVFLVGGRNLAANHGIQDHPSKDDRGENVNVVHIRSLKRMSAGQSFPTYEADYYDSRGAPDPIRIRFRTGLLVIPTEMATRNSVLRHFGDMVLKLLVDYPGGGFRSLPAARAHGRPGRSRATLQSYPDTFFWSRTRLTWLRLSWLRNRHKPLAVRAHNLPSGS